MSALVDAEVRAALGLLEPLTHDQPVLRRRDLLALGVTDATQSAMVRRGELVRLRHGVYVLREVIEGADGEARHRIDLAAAIAGGREPVWAFGPSSALVLGLPLPFVVPSSLTLARASGADERALRRPSRHRLVIPDARVVTGPIDPMLTSTERGVAVVGPALAAVSTAAELTSGRWRTALFDAALWRGSTTEDIRQLIDAWRHLGHREELLTALDRARIGAQTVFETLSRLALVEAGLPEPLLQHAFFDDRGLIGYADMWWPALNVIGEADGLVKYRTREDVIREKRREDRLRARGHGVVRWTPEEMEADPRRIADEIRRAARRVA